ncbi:MAG: hypothetical protein DWQ01_00860 [Planctomycetota bacterium]|nr:MAG: hypothetical protein DWQ01_00860 [Planctomycetota bacterium]
MHKFLAACAALVAGSFILPLALQAQETAEAASKSELRVGTFDSRVLAIAYYRSQEFQQYVDGIRARHDQAKTKGDEETAEKLASMMTEKQRHIHHQGFGTAPIPEILEKIQDDLEAVAQSAGVDVLVGKWDLVYTAPDCDFKDVSLLMADAFHPDEKTLKVLKDILETEPVSSEELDRHDH